MFVDVELLLFVFVFCVPGESFPELSGGPRYDNSSIGSPKFSSWSYRKRDQKHQLGSITLILINIEDRKHKIID